MACNTVCVGVILLLSLVCSQVYSSTDNRCLLQKPHCDICGLPVTVTLTVRNLLQPPLFELSTSVIVNHGVLLTILEEAAETKHSFRFKTTYLPSLGYFIDTINHREGSPENKTFWQVVSHNFGTLKCGVSRYIPADGETIIFNFTTYSDAGYSANVTGSL